MCRIVPIDTIIMPGHADRRIDMPTGVLICRPAYHYAESAYALNNQMGLLDKWELQSES
jgi:hypothetical protein